MVYKARDHRSITSGIIFPEFSAPANNVVSQLILCRRKFYPSYIHKKISNFIFKHFCHCYFLYCVWITKSWIQLYVST